jgi:aminoglycoside 6'-N-acetyltransferase I
LYAQAGFVEVDRWRVDDGSLELVRLRRSRKLAERSTALIDRPIQTVRVEPVASLPNDAWLQLRLALWPHCGAQEHLDEMAAFVAEPRRYAQFIAYDGAQAVGLAEAAVRHDYVNGAETSPVAFLEGLYVVPAARRNGIGGRLVAAVAAWARDQGIRELASDTAIDNLASHAMHKALGFEETERVVFFRMVLDNPAS